MGRQEVFEKVRAALGGGRKPDSLGACGQDDLGARSDVPTSKIAWEHGKPTKADNAIALFAERVADYKATVEHATDNTQIPVLVARFLREAEATSCVVPPELNKAWYEQAKTEGVRILIDDPPLSKEELNNTHVVITSAAVGIAETGTIALDHRPDQGRRIISLLSDTHICIIRVDQIATNVPEAISRLETTIREGQPITWISGPSATVDIELIRVEGVHGPRNLYVIIAP
jgi:L-lactate dehydrogenase complex protein LldG